MSTNKLKTDKARDHKLWFMCVFFYYIYSFLKKMDKKVECYLRRPAIPSPFYRIVTDRTAEGLTLHDVVGSSQVAVSSKSCSGVRPV